jgi:hypothetical protein
MHFNDSISSRLILMGNRLDDLIRKVEEEEEEEEEAFP